jgi:hypothetical protein
MALHNLSSALNKILNTLKKQPVGQGVEVLSYKRNRGISIIRQDNDMFYVREHGYNDEIWEVDIGRLPKLLKSAMKREFPRSRKVRIYNLSAFDEMNRPMKKL